ncbi:MAG: riboflavin biosynthesis protein RibF [Opitutaceae bacterium]|nr:riboflavin biosynthesis protein RibF [Opitutaceae bacterium]
MFDGLHLGHQAVIHAAVTAAKADRGVAAVLTFWPHPSAVLRPHGEPVRLLLSPRDKARQLAGLGVAVVITQPFTTAYAAMAAEEFLPRLQQGLPGLAAIYVGENWRFGRARSGDFALLQADGARLGLRVTEVPRVFADGEPVSSTRIRARLAAGDIEAANALLGYAYYALGPVKTGQALGRKIGFPTLNLAWEPGQRLRFGVYAVSVSRADGVESHPAVANYGVRPTVAGTGTPVLEAHLLGDCPFGAGDELRVAFHHFIRAERKFADLAALRNQISDDRETARAWFARGA